jgi:hypothetical protein
VFDPWAGRCSRSIGRSADLPSRLDLIAALSAEVGAISRRPGLAWEEPGLEGALAVREEGGRIFVDSRFSLSAGVRAATMAVGLLSFLASVVCAGGGACRHDGPMPLLATVAALAAGQIAARLRISLLVRRAVGRTCGRARSRLPRARARLR